MADVRYDEDGLPSVTWTESYRAGGHLNPWRRVERRCAIERMSDGALSLVAEESRDNSWIPVVVASVLVGLVVMWGFGLAFGVAAGVALCLGTWRRGWLRATGWGQQVTSARRPWAALDGFRLTSTVEYLGVRTMGGATPARPDPMIVASFGTAHPEVTVSLSDMRPDEVGDLHRVLTHELVVRRAEHVVRLEAA